MVWCQHQSAVFVHTMQSPKHQLKAAFALYACRMKLEVLPQGILAITTLVHLFYLKLC